MQEKKSMGKLVFVFQLIFIPILLMANVTSIKKIVTRNTQTDVSVCAEMHKYSYGSTTLDAKPYINIQPNNSFSSSWSYDAMCIKGLEPRTKYKFTFYKNMPLGENILDKSYSFEAITLDFAPSINFPEEGYILPTKGEISIPVETTNIEQLRVSLYLINSRSLIDSVNKYGFIRSLKSYQLDDIESEKGYKLWSKDLKLSKNRPNIVKTTAIPVGDFLQERKSGVYILYAQMLDEDGDVIYDYNDKTQWFMVSDIGLYTLQSDKGLTIFTKKLSSAESYKNVKLELIAKNNEILDSTISKNGKTFFPDSLLSGTGGLEAKAIYAYGNNDDFTVLDLSRPAHDLTDRGVDGRESPKNYDAYIYSNRGIFRPGESMDFHTLLRDKLAVAKVGLNLSVKLFDSREVNVYTKQFKTDSLGHFSDTIDISESSSTGKWRLSLFAGSDEAIANYTFLVEDFVPPKIKVELLKGLDYLKPEQNSSIQISAKFLNGEALPHANVEVNMIVHKSLNPFKKYNAYHFGDMKEKFRNKVLEPLTFETDDKGEQDIPLIIKNKYNTSLPLSVHIDIAVNELGGRPVHKSMTKFFENDSAYIGIKPNFENDAIDMDASAKFSLVYLSDQKLSETTLAYTLISEKTHWNWRTRSNSWEYYKTYSDSNVLSEGVLKTNATKPAVLDLKKLDWGNYRLILKDKEGRISSYRFTSGYEESSSKSSPDRLPVSIDKQTYVVGDTLRINIKPKFSGPVVVYIAHDELIESKTIQATVGKALEVSFKVKENWGSSTYVLATAFRAQSKKLGANRAVGVAPIKISHPEKELHLLMEHSKKVTSNSIVKVTIISKKAVKTNTHFTLAAVDQGVLNLTAYKAPDPVAYFLGQRKLGIEIRDIYADLIKARGEHAKFNVGSDAELAQAIRDDVISNKRKVVALFSEELSFNEKGVAEVELKIPDYQGALTLMAVAWNKKATGSAQSELIVKDEISMEYYMPLFISVGDKVETLFTVGFDTTVAPGNYQIKLSTEGGIELGNNVFDVSVDSRKPITWQKKIRMSANTKNDGTVRVEILKDGKVVKEKEWEIGVRSTYPETYVRNMGMLKKGASLNTTNLLDESLWSEVQNISLKISGNPLLPIESLKDELIDYTWRCAEQTTSRAMPGLFVKKRTVEQESIIRDAIDRLLTYQNINGGFGLWTGSRVDMWVSAYVLDFLTRAKKAGYTVPKQNMNAGLNWIENNLNRWSNTSRKQEADAYGLYVLARNGRVLMSELKYHATDKRSKIKSAQAWAHLASAFAYVGENKSAVKLFEKAKSALGYGYSNWYYSNYGGALRDQASLVALMYESKIGNVWENLFGDLALNAKKRTYFSTQEMSALLRVAFLLKNTKKVNLKLFSGNTLLPLKKGEFTTKAEGLNEIGEIKNASAANAWYDLSFKATPVSSHYDASHNNGFSISKTIYTMDGKKVDLAHVAQNKRMVIVLKGQIENTAIQNPLITDWMISGFELENPNLTGIDATSSLKWIGKQSKTEYAAYRNDRFAAALTLNNDKNNSFNIAYVVRAVSAGSFVMPPVKIEDMYQPRYRALSAFMNSRVYIGNTPSQSVVKVKPEDTNITKIHQAVQSNPNVVDALTEKDYSDVYMYPVGDLSKYTIVQLNFLRNAIFAHEGLSFEKSNPMLDKRFSVYSWYKPTTNKSGAVYLQLSPMLKANVQILLKEEKRRGGGLVLSDFYRVNSRILTKESLAKYDKESLRILRNSLFARYGLDFKVLAPELDTIYSYMPWYKPKKITVSKIFDEQMSEIEKSNILLMIELEKAF